MAMVLIVAFSLILHLTFWHFPLLSLDALQTSFQDQKFSDQNFYLHVASELCSASEWDSHDLKVTWSAVGVIGYLTYGCEIFGTEFFYIILNPVLVALAFYSVINAAHKIGINPKIPLISVLMIPYTFLTLSLPGKETISVVGTLFSVAGLIIFEKPGIRVRGILLICIGLVVVAINRLHEAGVLLLFIALWRFGLFKSIWRIIFIVLIGGVFADNLLGFALENQGAISITDEVLWSGSSEGKSLDLGGAFDLLRSDNIFLHSMLGSIRVLVVLSSPLTSLFTPFYVGDPAYFVFRDMSQRLRIIDLIFIAFVLYKFLRDKKNKDRSLISGKIYSLFPVLFVYMIFVISFFGVSQKSRYIFQYTPLLVLWVWLFLLPSRNARSVNGQ